jgi:hypothetical protein
VLQKTDENRLLEVIFAYTTQGLLQYKFKRGYLTPRRNCLPFHELVFLFQMLSSAKGRISERISKFSTIITSHNPNILCDLTKSNYIY